MLTRFSSLAFPGTRHLSGRSMAGAARRIHRPHRWARVRGAGPGSSSPSHLAKLDERLRRGDRHDHDLRKDPGRRNRRRSREADQAHRAVLPGHPRKAVDPRSAASVAAHPQSSEPSLLAPQSTIWPIQRLPRACWELMPKGSCGGALLGRACLATERCLERCSSLW